MSASHDHPHYFDCAGGDRAMYAMERWCPCWIHLRVDLAGSLQLDRLERAWRMLPAVHPILASTLPRPGLRPRWRPDSAEPTDLVVIKGIAPHRADAPGPEEQGLLNQGVDVRRSAPARLAVLEDEDGRQRLLLSVHHATMDARSVVAVGETLCRLYGELGRREAPVLEADWSPRAMMTVLRDVGFPSAERRRVVRTLRKNDLAIGKSTHRDPLDGKIRVRLDRPFTYRAWRFGPDALAPLETARREQGWTWNDVLLGLLAWSWAQALGAGTSERDMSIWMVAADLRPGLGITGGLGNLSGLEAVGLGGVESDDPVAAVKATAAEMGRRKAGFFGLGSQCNLHTFNRVTPAAAYGASFRSVARAVMKLLRFTRAFTNIGPVGDAVADWDGVTATDVLFLAPLPPQPMTIVSGNGYDGSIYVTMGYAEGWLADDQLDAMHRAMRRGLSALATA